MVLLEHAEHREKISKLRRDAGTALGELGRNRHLLRARLDDTLQNISQQHKKLDLLEQTAIDEMEKEDGEYQLLAGKCVVATIAPSEASFSTAFDALKDGGTAYDDTDSTHEYCIDEKLLESWEVNGDAGVFVAVLSEQLAGHWGAIGLGGGRELTWAPTLQHFHLGY
ncbi:hypothetical protein NLG97_g3889 [Lecanicillium saksenae]|nr:hypothetical protein NLG97_g3889 [Lecanicillium saksenae]